MRRGFAAAHLREQRRIGTLFSEPNPVCFRAVWAGNASSFASPFSGAPTIAKGRFRPQPRETGKRLRVNDQIRISPVRLIGEDNEQLGVIETDEARQRAREAGLDLVEVAPQASPPVCRIMDYGKWKYAQRKKEQKAKAHAKQSELKGMRLRPKIDDHDLMIKINKAREFLEDGDKVQFTMIFRGREMAHQNLGRQQMVEICEKLDDVSKVEQSPKIAGRRMIMVLTPDRSGGNNQKRQRDDAGDASEALSSLEMD